MKLMLDQLLRKILQKQFFLKTIIVLIYNFRYEQNILFQRFHYKFYQSLFRNPLNHIYFGCLSIYINIPKSIGPKPSSPCFIFRTIILLIVIFSFIIDYITILMSIIQIYNKFVNIFSPLVPLKERQCQSNSNSH